MHDKQTHQSNLFITITLDALVPTDNFYRRLSAVLDLRFLYKVTQSFYGTEGQASIDPVVFFKLLKWNRKTAVGKDVELNMSETNRNWTVLGQYWLHKLVFDVQTFLGSKNPNVNIATL